MSVSSAGYMPASPENVHEIKRNFDVLLDRHGAVDERGVCKAELIELPDPEQAWYSDHQEVPKSGMAERSDPYVMLSRTVEPNNTAVYRVRRQTPKADLDPDAKTAYQPADCYIISAAGILQRIYQQERPHEGRQPGVIEKPVDYFKAFDLLESFKPNLFERRPGPFKSLVRKVVRVINGPSDAISAGALGSSELPTGSRRFR